MMVDDDHLREEPFSKFKEKLLIEKGMVTNNTSVVAAPTAALVSSRLAAALRLNCDRSPGKIPALGVTRH